MSDKRKLWIPRSTAKGRPLPPAINRDTLLSLESRIKPDFRRAVVAGGLAIICLAVGNRMHGIDETGSFRPVAIGLTVAFAILGAGAVRSAARETFRVTALRGGPSAASAVRLVVSIAGYGLVLLGILQLVRVDLRSLLVGGAVTGVVVGIAAQQSLGNFFAGIVLMFSRPYVVGERVIIRSGALGGPFEGTIVDAGLLFTTMITEDGPVNLPNAGLLAAAIGPAPDPSEDSPSDRG